jgi:hypothetical protein
MIWRHGIPIFSNNLHEHLQRLPVPDAAWQTVTMDFIEGLPQSGANNNILVAVDKFMKY